MVLVLFVAIIVIVYYFYRTKYNVALDSLKNANHELDLVKQSLLDVTNDNVDLRIKVSNLEIEKQGLITRLSEKQDDISNVQQQLTLHFNKIATDLLEEKSRKFTIENKYNIESILNPLKEKILEFESQVNKVNKENLERHVELRTEVRNLHELNVKVTQEAKNLTNAIKGDTRIQGNWGEVILERVLENSGLVKNREYFVQKSFKTDDGKLYKPDIIIKLPNEKNIIIDSKVSLISYEKFFNSNSSEDKTNELKNYIISLKNHINSLNKKSYQAHYDINGLDFVIMFIPIESAFSLAISHDIGIFNYAYENNIVMTSPSTLLATVRTIANIWQSEYQNRNVLEIARQGGGLYDKFVSFMEDLRKLGKYLDSTKNAYDDSMKKLYEGKDNLVIKAEKIRQLGAKTTKLLGDDFK